MSAGLDFYVVNAFTGDTFGGNPAAVVPLQAWLPDRTLQAIAEQHNLSETAFFVPLEANRFELRWFTPGAEVELCGHATLASAFILKNCLGYPGSEVAFTTRFSGTLNATFCEDGIELDFPALRTDEHTPEEQLVAALGCEVVAAAMPSDHPWKALYEVQDEATLRAIRPDFSAIGAAVEHAVIVTARGQHCDFVSRVFAPNLRINEDPVTGAAHCVLTPYWASKLGKDTFQAAQLSLRGGQLQCSLVGDRVRIRGACVLFSRGQLIADLGEPGVA